MNKNYTFQNFYIFQKLCDFKDDSIQFKCRNISDKCMSYELTVNLTTKQNYNFINIKMLVFYGT